MTDAKDLARFLAEHGDQLTPQRLHDVRAAVARVRAVAAIVEKGYRFDDAQAAAYLELLKAAHATLDQIFVELEPLFLRAQPAR